MICKHYTSLIYIFIIDSYQIFYKYDHKSLKGQFATSYCPVKCRIVTLDIHVLISSVSHLFIALKLYSLGALGDLFLILSFSIINNDTNLTALMAPVLSTILTILYGEERRSVV